MTHDRWVDRLSEYLDHDLDEGERRELEAHLETCAECRGILATLHQVVGAAAAARDAEPAHDLWPGIAARIAQPAADVVPLRRPAVRRVSFTLSQLAAAAAVLLFVGGGAVWLAFQGGGTAPEAAARPEPAAAVRLAAAQYAGYDQAISELEAALEGNGGGLDTATVRVLRQSLGTIDRAIAEAKAALEQDPANPFLHRHLDGAMKKKIEILRTAVTVRRAQS